MQIKINRVAVLVAVVALMAGVAAAQTTTTEVQKGKVLYVSGNQVLVELNDGSTQLFDVPADFIFNIDGQKLTASQLKPGTVVSQSVTTTTIPEFVKTTEIREGEIVQRIGQTIIYRDEIGQIHKITGIPEGWIVVRDGEQVPIEALAGGDRATAYFAYKDITLVTEEELKIVRAGTAPATAPKPATTSKPATAPKPEPAQRVAPKPAPARAPAAMLPDTGSQLPLAGLAGLLALTIGLGIAVARRF